MPAIINVHKAKTQFSRLLERVHVGEEIIVSKSGKPYVRIVPLAPAVARRQPGRLKGISLEQSFLDPLPDEGLAAWERA